MDTIFQSSDLAQRRVEFLDAARSGVARLRDKDGTSLVMLPESRLDLLKALARWATTHLRLEALLRHEETPGTSALGDLAWLRVFSREDLQQFVEELSEAIILAYADEDMRPLEECVRSWRVTARQLEDPLRRSILLGTHSPEDFEEVGPPTVPTDESAEIR